MQMQITITWQHSNDTLNYEEKNLRKEEVDKNTRKRRGIEHTLLTVTVTVNQTFGLKGPKFWDQMAQMALGWNSRGTGLRHFSRTNVKLSAEVHLTPYRGLQAQSSYSSRGPFVREFDDQYLRCAVYC